MGAKTPRQIAGKGNTKPFLSMTPKTLLAKGTPKVGKAAYKSKRVVLEAFTGGDKNSLFRRQLMELRTKFGISQKALAHLASSSQRAIARWEAGEQPGELAKRTLTELSRLHGALTDVIQKEFIPEWLEAPNEALAGLKPREVVERGEIDRIWSLIYFLKSGEPS